MKSILTRLLVVAALIAAPLAAYASQGSGCIPTSGTLSGLSLVQGINAANDATISSNSGATAPSTACSGTPLLGQIWLDTTANLLKYFNGAQWLITGTIDAVSNVWKPVLGGGVETVASASTANLCAVPGSLVSLTGSTTITSFGTGCAPGSYKVLSFAGSISLTNSSALLLPGRADISAVSGDTAMAAYMGSGNWQVMSYSPASGQAVVNPSFEVGDLVYSMQATVGAKWALGYGQALSRATYPDYFASVTKTQSGARTLGSNVITVSDTAGMGAPMPVEGTGIPAGATVLSVTSSTITLAATCSGACNATSTGSSPVSVIFTGYGSGGSSSTVGAPDCRGAAMAGRDDMGGTAKNALTSAYFGTAATRMNAFGGAQSSTLLPANLPPYTPSGSIITTMTNDNAAKASSPVTVGSGGTSSLQILGTANITASSSFTGAAQGGTSTPFGTIQPTLVANCKVRVLL